ncbi:UvrD-helicase domain-containing protein [Paracoccaceae bacterium Fryx2]|nr:UvrD-helicase domain-containing protein [Paracoccaceae bacterium Fryx2]
MTNDLTLVPAGAGSGKTHRIEQELAGLVERGQVGASRILAVTFTESAAAELRGRIRGELMKRGRIEDALAIDRAYVGTIHALGQRLLTEHTFAAGRNPDARLVTEAERDLLIRREVGRSAALLPIISDLERFGYAWDRVSGDSAEDSFRKAVLKTTDLLRGLGNRAMDPDIAAGALDFIRQTYGVCDNDGTALETSLRRACGELLSAFPNCIATPDMANAARDAFWSDFRNLRDAAHKPDELARNWPLWQKLRGLRMTKRGCPTPSGYDDRAQAVMTAADGLLRHPGPLQDALTHLTALVQGVQGAMAAYAGAKRQAGLIDYADMIADTEALLRSQPDILASVVAEIDCVVIDEFQDTNPVQFALLWRLAQAAPRALIVGDTKQAIMDFQGADPRLAAALEAKFPACVQPQDRNWRSDPRIMAFINAIGPRLFPGAYTPLAPTRAETGVTALEAISRPSSWTDKKDHTADCAADRIAAILSDAEQVVCPVEKTRRAARPADIAVLCYTRAQGAKVADALRKRGLPARIQSEGWLEAPATSVARAAIALVADPDDRLAALGLVTRGPARMPLAQALRATIDTTLDAHSDLERLAEISALVRDLPVGDLVPRIIAAARLRDWAKGLAAPEQALADLARLEAEARVFDQLPDELKSAAGFFGSGPQVFLGWLAAQTERDFDRHPDPAGWSAPGVEVVTWHAAKGREWPITVVLGLDQKIVERPNTLRADFSDFDDLSHVLEKAGLHWTPNLAAPEKQLPFQEARQAADEASAARLMYVALTRARDRLILMVPPPPSKPKDRPERMIDLLRDRTGLTLAMDGTGLKACDSVFPARITALGREWVEPPMIAEPVDPVASFGMLKPHAGGGRTPWRQSPSTLVAALDGPAPHLQHADLGPRIGVARDGIGLATDRGTAWHLAFRVLSERPEMTARLSTASGLDPATLDAIAAQSSAMRDWLAAQGYTRLHHELPLQITALDGSQINGVIDCLAEGPEGYAIIDHKSGPCPDPDTRFATYLPQLRAYAAAVEHCMPGKPVRLLAINWMNEGRISSHRISEPESVT